MESFKDFVETLTKKLRAFIDSGDLKKANTVTANMMSATVLIIISVMVILCWILNEFGIFSVDKTAMRISTVVTLVIQIPINVIVRIYHGDKPWIRGLLLGGLIINCMTLQGTVGHNATLVMVLPVILSIRYYDRNFSRKVALASVIAALAGTLYCANFGVINLNMVDMPIGTEIVVIDTFRQAVISTGIDEAEFIKSMILNDFLPRFLAFAVIAVLCIMISDRGNQMIELQKEISTKSARVTTELDLATQIQAGMLPCIFPAFPAHLEIELYAKNIPAKEVGGDFYDYFKIDDDHVALVMADVSGKGVGAALFMTISKTIIKNLLQQGASPAEALAKANEQLCENNEAGLFVTVWAGVYEISTGTLMYVNAGHNPPVIIRDGQPAESLIDRHCFVLAGFESCRYTENELKLHAGDELILYTDGVTEATSKNLELYGDNRWVAFCEAHRELSSKEQTELAFEELEAFADGADQFDDITILIMKVKSES